ncbi:bifunctional RNase H/acid phosphatase [Allokutzneria sp. A3M-2-11 16]|uniref:bifunctional RNase H/acid phosphatase n=1 Tax=Allokutzneria sp. A3M-2-11 16 TaxID=2962043 RepID=UPI0020B7ED91|nr:bifunctional RNase H/acid phosphatase [Allokutzneria sp. A3M-2-11 16]MCP3801162.1 bifunctional RNase H/acid phosphatase [Allokutzneria sp. A3M-2-11 16]
MTTRVIVEADGGSRGNPGPAGYGAVVLDAATGEVLAERSAGIGVATNNVAEYQGLIAGLTAAVDLGAEAVEVRMDSKLVIEQMAGRWKVKHPSMQPLAAEAKQLVTSFDRVQWTWIPRERNKRADRLANVAMDAQAGKAAPQEKPAAREKPAAPPSWTGATGVPTRLILLRHGQTPLSVERRYSGRGDAQLTEEGQRQAAAAAQRLGKLTDVAAVVSSPLSRAAHTARGVADALGVEPVALDGLIETDFGSWEGLTFAEAAERDPDLHRSWLADTSIAPPGGGESFDAVHRRVRRCRDDLIARYGGSTIVVVSHVTPIKALLRMALDVGPSLLFRLHLDLASVSVAEFYPDGHASVRLVNDTSHLG